MQEYIGIKILKAKPMSLGDYNKHRGWEIPENEDSEREGYLVEYKEGYLSWSPKEIFESAYFHMSEDSSKVSPQMIDAFIGDLQATQLDGKTTLVKAETISGFIQYEVASCVEPKNYDMELGKQIATKRIKETLWLCLGFVLQWGRFGIKN